MTNILERCFDDVESIDARHNYALFDTETVKKFYVVDEHDYQRFIYILCRKF